MAEEQVAEAAHEGVVLTLSTDRRVYRFGETVVAEACVQNTSRIPVSYATGHIGDPAIRVTLTGTPTGEEIELHERGRES